jgi:endonuclease III related protein
MPNYPCYDIPYNLHQIFEQLLEQYGLQHWWPGITRDEIIIGAILTQNTNWVNVDKAINNLKQADACSLESCALLDLNTLEQLIKPSGFYRVKAKRLKQISKALIELRNQRLLLPEFRNELLSLEGIGPETADSILLYAFNLPIFVVDAYTRRIYSRMNITNDKATYHEIQQLFQKSLPFDTSLFNEYHALIVKHAKEICKTKPKCESCLWGNLGHR